MATPGPSAAEPPLTDAQQQAVQQLQEMTAQSADDATALLRRSGWSVTVAVSKFFDGDAATPDLDNMVPPTQRPPSALDPLAPDNGPPRIIDLGDPLSGFQPRPRPVHDIFQEAIHAVNENNRRMAAERTEVARRIVPPAPAAVVRPPFLVSFLLSPFHLGYRLLAGLWRVLTYVFGLVPRAVGLRRPRTVAPRRQLNPRDAAARFKREFEETYGSKALPFAEMGYTQAYDKAKAEPMYLLIVLLAREHDDTRAYCRDTLLHPDVVAFVNDPANNVLLWGGNVCDPEAFQVSIEHRVTKFPFTGIVCVTPKEGGSTRMGTVKRFLGAITPQNLLVQLRAVQRKYTDDLAAVRAVRVANEASRNIRIEQDNAYERSLARDRERARQRQEAERLAREKAEAAARQARLYKQWRAWRAARLAPEPPTGTPDMVRVALKLPEALGGARVSRRFASGATVEDLYAFVECHHFEQPDCEGNEGGENDAVDADGESENNEAPAEPEGYTHKYQFRIASMMPRELHEPSETKTLLEAIGKSASLIVEDVEESESGDEVEGQGLTSA